MMKKIISIGDSIGVIIPHEFLTVLDLKEGNEVVITINLSGKKIVISKKEEKQNLSGID
mgnify:CR=1 FL=1